MVVSVSEGADLGGLCPLEGIVGEADAVETITADDHDDPSNGVPFGEPPSVHDFGARAYWGGWGGCRVLHGEHYGVLRFNVQEVSDDLKRKPQKTRKK